MFRHELSTFLQRVLDAVCRDTAGVRVSAGGEPDIEDLERIAHRVGAPLDATRWALIGLRAGDCLTDLDVEFEGIETARWWAVHPQCRV